MKNNSFPEDSFAWSSQMFLQFIRLEFWIVYIHSKFMLPWGYLYIFLKFIWSLKITIYSWNMNFMLREFFIIMKTNFLACFQDTSTEQGWYKYQVEYKSLEQLDKVYKKIYLFNEFLYVKEFSIQFFIFWYTMMTWKINID